MSRVRLTDRAKTDLDGIWHYIGVSRRNLSAADGYLSMLYDKLRLLSTQPLMGQTRDDLTLGLRTFAGGNYVILYYPMTDGIEVVGVVYGAQDVEAMFRTGNR